MNNYCTNCGEKLEKKDIKCKICGTPIIDVTKIPKKMNKKILIIIGSIFAGIVLLVLFYSFVYPYLLMPFIKNKLKNDFNASNIEISSPKACYICDSSCDGSCLSHRYVFNCFEYKVKYKSDDKLYNIELTYDDWKFKTMMNLDNEYYEDVRYPHNEENYLEEYGYIDDNNSGYYTNDGNNYSYYGDNVQ